MNVRLILLSLTLLAPPLFADHYSGDPVPPARNKDGSIVTGVLTARFDPSAGLEGVPIPSNLFFSGTRDLTLNAPTAGLDASAAALVAQINALDGFSTIEKWTTTFVDDDGNPGAIDPASVVPGQSVRVFQVKTEGVVAVTRVVSELTPGFGGDYIAVASGNVVAIIPLRPLPEYSSFMAVLTNDIKDMDGNDATPDQTYFLAKRPEPWLDANGNSTYALVDNATATLLEGLRQITASMEFAAASEGIDPDDIILSWTVQTQAITPVLKQLRSVTMPSAVTTAPINLDTQAVGGRGFADIHVGVITVPYYLGVPSAENPTAPLNQPWQAEPGAYVPPFDQLIPNADPTSTHVTLANPFPVVRSMQTIPLMLTVPNIMPKPEAGWPVVIYGHPLGSNRASVLAVADALAAAGFAAVAIDFPLHGVVPETDPLFGAFDIEQTPFGALADERTFRVDYVNNATGQPGPDGVPDASGTHALNFQNFLVTRDNLRQGVADLFVLANSIQNFDLDADSVPDLQPFILGYAGMSLGAINGAPFAAIEPLVTRAFLSVPAGGLVRAFEASPTFGPRIRGGLAAAGIFPGDPMFELYLTVGQTAVGGADPINWIRELTMIRQQPTLLHEVVGDSVLPNYVLTAPLSGTEPLISVGGLDLYSATEIDAAGLHVAGRFLPPATHASLLDPSASLAATAEMQAQMATFLSSGGTAVQVANPEVMVPVVDVEPLIVDQPRIRGGGKQKPRFGPMLERRHAPEFIERPTD